MTRTLVCASKEPMCVDPRRERLSRAPHENILRLFAAMQISGISTRVCVGKLRAQGPMIVRPYRYMRYTREIGVYPCGYPRTVVKTRIEAPKGVPHEPALAFFQLGPFQSLHKRCTCIYAHSWMSMSEFVNTRVDCAQTFLPPEGESQVVNGPR